MAKTAVIYWSGTGNTEAMAEEIIKGAREVGEAELFRVSEISSDDAARFENLALGCAAMGAEVLEEYEFEPFFAALEKNLSGKKIALFGSYGWGDGQWMRDWEERIKNAGAVLTEPGLMVNYAPGDAEKMQCRQLGKALAGA